jgi:tetratricopeptide (TPR) repeat protein
MATFVGILIGTAITALTVRVSYREAVKSLAGGAVLSAELEQDRNDLERARKEEPQRTAASSELQQVADQTKPQLSPVSSQLLELRREVDRLQQNLEQERQDATFLRAEVKRYREAAATVERQMEEANRALQEREYFRLLNEALAYAYRQGPGDDERAEAAFRNAIQIARTENRPDPVIYNSYAVFLHERNRLEEAEEFYQAALQINPRYGNALFNLASLYELKGDVKRAMEKYKAAGEVGVKQGSENYSRLRLIFKQ